MPTGAELLIGHYRPGSGYASARWRNSKLIEAVPDREPDRPRLYDIPEPILLHKRRDLHDLDAFTDDSASKFIGYSNDPLDRQVREQGAAEVLASVRLDGSDLRFERWLPVSEEAPNCLLECSRRHWWGDPAPSSRDTMIHYHSAGLEVRKFAAIDAYESP